MTTHPEEHPAFERVLDRILVLAPDEREAVRRLSAASEIVPAHRRLIESGKAYKSAFIVKSGWLIRFKLFRNGRRQILNFRLPGEIGGLDSLAYLKAPHTVATLTECTIAPIGLEALEDLQRTHPRLAMGIFLFSLREEAILNEWEVNLGQRCAYARIAHLILELDYRLRARKLAAAGAFRFPPTQQDIADSVGLTTPYVNRILGQMREEGSIRLADRRLEILDAPRLEQASGFRASYLEDWGRSKPEQAEPITPA